METPEGRMPAGRTRHRWYDNFKVDLEERGWRSMDWIALAENRDRWWALVDLVINLQIL